MRSSRSRRTSTPPMEVDEVRSLAAELAIQRVSHCSLTLRRGGPAAPRSGCGRASSPAVTADVLLDECGQPVFDGGHRSRAVLVVLFVAQQRGQCGGVGELLHRRRDFATVRSS